MICFVHMTDSMRLPFLNKSADESNGFDHPLYPVS